MTNDFPITTLFLDLGGVLLTNGWDRKARKLAARVYNLDLEELEERHHLTFATYESGKIDLEDYLHRVIFYEKRTFDKKQFINFMFEQSKPFPEMIQLIHKLKQQYKLKIAVITNEGRELVEYRIQKYKLGSFVDFFIASCFVHFRKPDADIFHIALDIAQVSASQVLYIEDRAMFILVANELGIKSICHTDYHSTVEKLASFGLKDIQST